MPHTMDESNMNAIVDWFENRPINKLNRGILAQRIQECLDFVPTDCGPNVKMLDYACGFGFLSKIFAPHVASILAIDTSPVMIAKYKTEMADCACGVDARVGDLLGGETEEYRDVRDIDLITVGAALHHFDSAEGAIEQLAMRLRAGGVLYVQDILDGGEEGNEARKRPKGYTMEDMRSMMERAGLVNVEFEVLVPEMKVELMSEEVLTVACFAARGKKLVTM